MPDEEFQKLSKEEQNAQWDRELDSMTEEDWGRFFFNCTGHHLGDPIPPGELGGCGEVADKARRIKRYFINDAKSFASCSLHPCSFRWVTVALSYGGCLGPRLTQFTFRNLIFPDDLVVFEQGTNLGADLDRRVFGCFPTRSTWG